MIGHFLGRMESRIKKFTPHYIYRYKFGNGLYSGDYSKAPDDESVTLPLPPLIRPRHWPIMNNHIAVGS